jgi:hypothetical protein
VSVSAPVRVALVGCGRISANHFDAIARVEGLTLTAVCDVVDSRARAAGEGRGVPWFTNYEEMLAAAPCDAVAIATPSGLHPAHGILAAGAGKHVISEKPMGIFSRRRLFCLNSFSSTKNIYQYHHNNPIAGLDGSVNQERCVCNMQASTGSINQGEHYEEIRSFGTS